MDSVVDYTDFTYLDMPWEDRQKLRVGDIFFNQAKCKLCGWVIRSKNLHHMATCKCGAISIDGGSQYVKLSGDMDNIELHTVLYNDIPLEDEEDRGKLIPVNA